MKLKCAQQRHGHIWNVKSTSGARKQLQREEKFARLKFEINAKD